MAVWECYIAMIEMKDQQKMMCIGEQRAIIEPIEELEEVNLDDAWLERMTRIGTAAQSIQARRRSLPIFSHFTSRY